MFFSNLPVLIKLGGGKKMKININALFDLTGKTAVVTGASQGIGSEIAKLRSI